MVSAFRLRSPSAVLAAALAFLPFQEPIADVRKVTDTRGQEVPYPTRLTEVVAGATSGRAVEPPSAVGGGEAILTKLAHTHVRMRSGQPDAVLFQNTFVRFDTANQWLLRQGAAFVVNRRGKLALVVEGLETLFVGSEVYVEVTPDGLLAYVLEGSVILGATASGITLGPSQAGRMARGGVPQRTVLSPAQQVQIDRQIRLARTLMGTGAAAPVQAQAGGGGGGGGKALGVLLGLGAVGAGAYVLTHQKQPDLVAVPGTGGGFCRIEGNTVTVTVQNQGEKDSPPTRTRVDFEEDPRRVPQFFATTALAPGQTATVAPLTVPRCFPCRIQITVDADSQAQESDEGNNVRVGTCFSGEG